MLNNCDNDITPCCHSNSLKTLLIKQPHCFISVDLDFILNHQCRSWLQPSHQHRSYTSISNHQCKSGTPLPILHQFTEIDQGTHWSSLLGSVILPPSCVPEQNLMFPYIVLSYVSLCFWPVSTSHPDLSPPYCTSLYFTFLTSVHLSICHPSPVPLIFLSVRLDFPQTPFGLVFHLIIPVLARIVFKTKPCIHSSFRIHT